jgi:ADP-L-glycero-D-manno-heptose 6-epimerase
MIVVTGGAGFIGSNIVARLCESGAWDVVVCDRLETADLAKWKNIAKHPIADLWAPEELFDQLERHADRIEAVIHMGAISSTTEPDADLILRTNFSLSRDIWDWCAVRNVRMIYASSAATYGDGESGFEDRDDPESLNALRPLNAYGWSKFLFDQHAVRQADEGHAPSQWAGLKFFNVYGPNEGHKGTMKSVVAQIWPKVRAGEPVTLFRSHHPDYADGGQMRDFVGNDRSAHMIGCLNQPPVDADAIAVGTAAPTLLRARNRHRHFVQLRRSAIIAHIALEQRLRFAFEPASDPRGHAFFRAAQHQLTIIEHRIAPGGRIPHQSQGTTAILHRPAGLGGASPWHFGVLFSQPIGARMGKGQRFVGMRPAWQSDVDRAAIGCEPQGQPLGNAVMAQDNRDSLTIELDLRLDRCAFEPIDHEAARSEREGPQSTIWCSSGPASVSHTTRPTTEMPAWITASRSPLMR